MKRISEVIAELTAIRGQYGDLRVVLYDNATDEEHEVSDVEFNDDAGLVAMVTFYSEEV